MDAERQFTNLFLEGGILGGERLVLGPECLTLDAECLVLFQDGCVVTLQDAKALVEEGVLLGQPGLCLAETVDFGLEAEEETTIMARGATHTLRIGMCDSTIQANLSGAGGATAETGRIRVVQPWAQATGRPSPI
jgi:hypothetical protein